jgi:hypothetical protein
MKIEFEAIPTGTIEEFADHYGLTMFVSERETDVGDKDRYCASFRGVEVREGRCLASRSGFGPTPEAAIADYARWLSLKPIAINAFQPERIDTKAWRFVDGGGDANAKKVDK